MQLDLNDQDAELLGSALQSRIEALTRELARTEQRELQHELAQLVSRLEVIAARLEAARSWQPAHPGAASPH